MIFKPELAAKVLDGSKTMTRRRTRYRSPFRYAIDCRYVPGRTYAVQDRRGGRALGRILVEDVYDERVGTISMRDAQREGFADSAEFLRYWGALYGHDFDRMELVYVISFRLVDPLNEDAGHAVTSAAGRPGPTGGPDAT